MSLDLQTRVTHEFRNSNGHQMIGPGAQVHVTFDGSGKLVQLHHATRELKEGPTVEVFSEDEARRRVAERFPHDTTINVWVSRTCVWRRFPTARRSAPSGPRRDSPAHPSFPLSASTLRAHLVLETLRRAPSRSRARS